MTEEELAMVRTAFARQILAVAGVAGNAALEHAFRTVRRENFLGSEPWKIVDFTTAPANLPSNDPVYAYQDVLFVLSSWRGVNNGGPSLHARLLNALSPRPGQTVVHLGAGTGYYSAILAELVGPQGRVIAVEIDEVLARTARTALSHFPNVEVVVDDAAAWPREPADRIYVNFAVLAPQERWIEHLAPGGRLVFPLGVPGQPFRPAGPRFSRHGAAFLVERKDSGFGAFHICAAYFIHADGSAGVSDEAEQERLQNAFRRSGAEFVRSLVWRRPADPARCWICSPGWSLSYDPVE
ncbi:methyltransferase domain-containing protein [Chelativorans sp. AA-79]|uniref:protein-L-isoaspartate O-methyltransferase family protein n=1 Tax=Chelativorans sp. AA-79 TaxID=3028735 RepID=UPI0023F85A93|nr:methyltransferase domain-containing protein [Chelativorans sp. AA-79]WEX07877.1 methyltransferase domain-containing protein [Chelativorans sp. AA-79]